MFVKLFDDVWRCLIKWNNDIFDIFWITQSNQPNNHRKYYKFSQYYKLFYSNPIKYFSFPLLFFLRFFSRVKEELKFILYDLFTYFLSRYRGTNDRKIIWRRLIKWNNDINIWHKLFESGSILFQWNEYPTRSPRRERAIIRIINPRRDEFPLFTQPPVPRISNNLSNERYLSTSPPPSSPPEYA